MTIDWVDIAITILTAGLFSLIGFVWKWSHKVTGMEKDVEDNTRRIRSMERDHDKVMDRIYSMNKDRSQFMTRESFRSDSREIRDALDKLHREQDHNK
tara:strand:- start:191 stop:484 length:294 start_codon:yes stop_codon:yes gene_type:complete